MKMVFAARTLALATAAAVVALASTQAEAGWLMHRSHGGVASSGSVGSHGSTGIYASHGSSGSYGSYGAPVKVVVRHSASSGSYGASYGSTAVVASSGSASSGGASSGGASSGSYGEPRLGLLQRLYLKLHARKMALHSASSGSTGSHGVASHGSTGSTGSHGVYVPAPVYHAPVGSHGGGSVGGGSHGYAPVHHDAAPIEYHSVPAEVAPAPAAPVAPVPAADPAPAGDTDTVLDGKTTQVAPDAGIRTSVASSVLDNRVRLLVEVPEDAQVFINDRPTTSTGTRRTYFTGAVAPGATYKFRVRAEVERNGKHLQETKTVSATAGGVESLAFNFKPQKLEVSPETVTQVTLNVPENAKVNLAGIDAPSKGKTRVFATRQLRRGETWEDYTVTVTINQDGRDVVQSRRITLSGGEHRKLAFNFEDGKAGDLAAR